MVVAVLLDTLILFNQIAMVCNHHLAAPAHKDLVAAQPMELLAALHSQRKLLAVAVEVEVAPEVAVAMGSLAQVLVQHFQVERVPAGQEAQVILGHLQDQHTEQGVEVLKLLIH
jgi:hypothetical protein